MKWFLCLQSMFFFLAQTEQGDIFKITLETDEDMVRQWHYILESLNIILDEWFFSYILLVLTAFGAVIYLYHLQPV